MKLAIIHDWLTGMRGGEKCLEIVCRRFPDARLYTLLRRRGATSPAIERMNITTSFLQRVPGITRLYRYFLPLMPRAVQQLRIPADVDLVLSFNHAVAKGVRVAAGVPHVCYCFTPMRYAWHLRQEYFGESNAIAESRFKTLARTCKAPMAFARNRMLDRVRQWDHDVAQRVTHFVAISRTISERIAQCYGRTSTLIYPPVDTDYYCPADVERQEFYLCVSALVPYKRIDLAVDACNRLGRKLIVIGEGPSKKKLQRRAGSTVHFLGWKSNEEIRDQLRRCRALLFPGIEDFGIVPLEAQACGAPVIALGRGGALETVIGADEHRVGTGLFFPEQTIDSFCQAIAGFEQQPHWFSTGLARRQAERFAADRYEQQLVRFLEQVAGDASDREHFIPATFESMRKAA